MSFLGTQKHSNAGSNRTFVPVNIAVIIRNISLQGNPDSHFFPKKRSVPKRMSFSASLTGSMSVEAAAVLPIFLFAMMNLLSLFLMFQRFGNELVKLHQTGRELAMLGYEKDGGSPSEGNMIRLVRPWRVKPLVPIAGYSGTLVVNCCYMRMWNGYDALESDGAFQAGEEIVYLTENGSVYHRDRGCRHLELLIQLVDRQETEALRNPSGEKYYACEKCGGKEQGNVYITEEGNRYHASLSCSALKRTIRAVPRSETGGLPACSKCG